MNASSMCGTSQPPWVNPSLVSSSGDPGPCATPSNDRNSVSVNFIVCCPLSVAGTPIWRRRVVCSRLRLLLCEFGELLRDGAPPVVKTHFFMHVSICVAVSYTHLRAHETGRNLVCRLL